MQDIDHNKINEFTLYFAVLNVIYEVMPTNKLRIHSYMKHNKISSLFEELMGKIIEELPANPVCYLIEVLQKKVVEDCNLGKTPANSEAKKLWSTQQDTEMKPSSDKLNKTTGDMRQYEKPWLSNSRKTRRNDLLRQKLAATKKGIDGKDSKAAADNVATATDSLQVEGNEKDEKRLYKIYGEKRKVEVKGVDDEIKCYNGGETEKTKSENEAMKPDKETDPRHTLKEQPTNEYVNGATSGESDDEDEARELCEDYDQLKMEGVKNPPKSGIHISERGTRRKEQIELVFNISKFFDNLGGTLPEASMKSETRPSGYYDDDLEDFESASQVTGPRKPVWEQADVESYVTSNQVNSSRNFNKNTTVFDQLQQSPASSTTKKQASRSSATSKNSRISPGKLSGMKAEHRLRPQQATTSSFVIKKTKSLTGENVKAASSRTKDAKQRASSTVGPSH